MTLIIRLNQIIAQYIHAIFEPWLSQFVARFAFAAVLMNYYWASAMTKIGESL
jgi:hypothetical protein